MARDTARPASGAPTATPPCNIEAEQGLLGALLLNNALHDRLPAGFSSAAFYEPVHARIFDVIERHMRLGRVASPVSIKTFFVLDKGLEDLGGAGYLARMAGSAVDLGSVADYARLITDLWARREALRALDEARDKIAALDEESDHTSALEALQLDLGLTMEALSPAPLYTTLRQAFDEAANRTNVAFQNDGRPLVSTGLARLDAVTGGFIPADHFVLMGESSMGKTALALSIAWSVLNQGKGVFIGSLEMPAEQLAHRLASAVLAERGHRIEYNRLITGRVSEEEFRLFLTVGGEIQSLPLVFAEDTSSSLPKLATAAAAAHRRHPHGLGLVLIDYLQLVRVPDAKSRTEEVGAAAQGMKRLAKSLGCPVVSLSQMNRGNEGRDNPRPSKRDARQSGEIEESADVMIGIYREAYYLERQIQGLRGVPGKEAEVSEKIMRLEQRKQELELIVIKNRRGPLETVFEWIDLPVNRVADEDPNTPTPPSPQERMDFA